MVNDSYINVSTDRIKGFDFTIRYSKDIGPGNLLVNALITKMRSRTYKLFPEDPLTEYTGLLRYPEKTATVDVQYKLRQWKVRYGLEWIDKMSSYFYYEEDPATSTYKMDTPSYMRHNLSAEYKADKWSVIVGVRNLTDKEPPPISQGFANRRGNAPLYSGFDYVGRTWFVNGTFAF